MAKRIALSGGGTGGHLFPLVAVADYIRQQQWQDQELEFMFFGPSGKIETAVMSSHGIEQKKIISAKYRRYFSWKNVVDIFKFPISLVQAAWQLFWYMPDVVFAKGGHTSVPVVISARIFRVPVLIHESDAVPGMANKFMGSIASKCAVCFDKARMFFPPSRTIVTGVPIREEAINGDAQKAREFLKLPDHQKPVVFFMGGSLGAKAINEQVVENIQELLQKYQVIHQTGKEHFEIILALMKEKGIEVENSDYRPIAFYGDEIRDIYALADVIISRAGATSIAEIAANQKPCILIPYPFSANGHQRANAFEVAKVGGAIVLEEDNFKRGMLLFNLEQITTDENLRQKLITNVAGFYHPEATQVLSEELMALLK